MQVVIFACSILSLGAVLGTLPNSREGKYIPYTSRVLTDVPRSGHQVVIFACSILSLGTVLGALPVQRLRRSTLFVDVLSVKEFPKRLMLSLLPPEVRPETLTETLTPCTWRDRFAPVACPPCRSRYRPGNCAAVQTFVSKLEDCEFFCAQVDILCTHPMFGPDSGKASWQGLNLMFERVRIGGQPERRQRADNFLQVAPFAPYHHADRPLLRCTPRLWKGGNVISLHRR